jgi:hypothetical protein
MRIKKAIPAHEKMRRILKNRICQKKILKFHDKAELKSRVLKKLTLTEFSREYNKIIYIIDRKRKKITLINFNFIYRKIFPELTESNKEAAKKKIQN